MALTVDLKRLALELDLRDVNQIIQYYRTHTKEEVEALEVALLKDCNRMMTEMSSSIDKTIVKLRADQASFFQHIGNAFASSLGEESLPPPSIGGKFYPDGMPTEYQNPQTFDDWISLPETFLNAWYLFYKSDYAPNPVTLTPFDKSCAIWAAIGGHPDLMVEPGSVRTAAASLQTNREIPTARRVSKKSSDLIIKGKKKKGRKARTVNSHAART
ncbi:hypothetical protein CI109_104853 [Kwoniella shandongensis]|uniref:Uncharacterized protein n=1 Tax=Kwoniella shandongensis TaxID=1734106 RepID=A0A5M6BTF6_9TREE|nr:uncharacterized protein CI109_006162 [Kwoniella shandongensis]KAA5525471.1 hypothetical protein CI109_006162 [Kwoniella shandongensis]